jgi:hypothetical protein
LPIAPPAGANSCSSWPEVRCSPRVGSAPSKNHPPSSPHGG